MPRILPTSGWLLRPMLRALLLGLAAGLVVGILALADEERAERTEPLRAEAAEAESAG